MSASTPPQPTHSVRSLVERSQRGPFAVVSGASLSTGGAPSSSVHLAAARRRPEGLRTASSTGASARLEGEGRCQRKGWVKSGPVSWYQV
jgi:hypothetical protein